jgi:hypothetical protein
MIAFFAFQVHETVQFVQPELDRLVSYALNKELACCGRFSHEGAELCFQAFNSLSELGSIVDLPHIKIEKQPMHGTTLSLSRLQRFAVASLFSLFSCHKRLLFAV